MKKTRQLLRQENWCEAHPILGVGVIRKRQQGRCYLCGGRFKGAKPTWDHVIPLIRGGRHGQCNMALAHRSCNIRKGSKLPTRMAFYPEWFDANCTGAIEDA